MTDENALCVHPDRFLTCPNDSSLRSYALICVWASIVQTTVLGAFILYITLYVKVHPRDVQRDVRDSNSAHQKDHALIVTKLDALRAQIESKGDGTETITKILDHFPPRKE